MYVTFPIAILVEIGLPILLAVWVVRRFKVGWKLVGIGALIFVAAQLVHIPLLSLVSPALAESPIKNWPRINQVLFNGVFLGLMAGIFEETARLIGFRLLKDRARTWKEALALGIGHGGIESLLLAGLPVLITFVALLQYRFGSQYGDPLLSQQFDPLLAMPWHIPLAGAVERISAITSQITFAMIILQVFIRRNILFYVAAVLWHAFMDFLAVFLTGIGWSAWPLEGVMAVIALMNLGILLWLIRNEPAPLAEPAAEAI
jgi:uncharacterized membrane protein YhfC